MVEHTFLDPAPKLSDSYLNDWFKKEYQHMSDLYCDGDIFRLSQVKDKAFYLSEYMRALYVLQLHGFSELPKYSIAPHVARDVLINYKKVSEDKIKDPDFKISSVISGKDKSGKRKDKYEEVTQWCKQNAGKKVKVKDVAELVGWSYPTANNFVQSRVDLFVKFSHGVYTLRNPDDDRAKDKKVSVVKEENIVVERKAKRNAPTKGRPKKV